MNIIHTPQADNLIFVTVDVRAGQGLTVNNRLSRGEDLTLYNSSFWLTTRLSMRVQPAQASLYSVFESG